MKSSAQLQQRPVTAALTARLGAYLELAKPRLSALVLVTMLAGFYIGADGSPNVPLLLAAVTGTALVAGGAAALNQWAERDGDALMERTKSRPLPAGRLSADEVLVVGAGACAVGVAALAVGANVLTSGLALTTAVVYLFAYTPLKTRTPWCTVIGAVPGAIPPLMGYAAARGRLEIEAWVLFGILFLWQLPHFFAIAWMYRDDYRRAGCPMLAVLDRQGKKTARWVLILAAGLTAFSLAPVGLGLTGPVYPAWALVLGCGFAATAMTMARTRSRARARNVFLASIIYLPALLAVLMLDWTGGA